MDQLEHELRQRRDLAGVAVGEVELVVRQPAVVGEREVPGAGERRRVRDVEQRRGADDAPHAERERRVLAGGVGVA